MGFGRSVPRFFAKGLAKPATPNSFSRNEARSNGFSFLPNHFQIQCIPFSQTPQIFKVLGPKYTYRSARPFQIDPAPIGGTQREMRSLIFSAPTNFRCAHEQMKFATKCRFYVNSFKSELRHAFFHSTFRAKVLGVRLPGVIPTF